MAAAFPPSLDRDTGNSPSRLRYLPQAPPRKSWDDLKMAVVTPRINVEQNETFIITLAQHAALMPEAHENNIARARELRNVELKQQQMDDAQVDLENPANLAPPINPPVRSSPPSYDSDSGPDVESDNSSDQEPDDRPPPPSTSNRPPPPSTSNRPPPPSTFRFSCCPHTERHPLNTNLTTTRGEGSSPSTSGRELPQPRWLADYLARRRRTVRT